MKRQASLAHLQQRVLKRFAALRPLVVDALAASPRGRVRLLTFVTVDLHNTCSAFLRSYFLSSATSAWLSNGMRITNPYAFRTQRDALTFAVKLVNSKQGGNGPWLRHQEPAWHRSGLFLRILNAAGCSNAAGVNAAWSVGTNALTDLTTARNYFAHRNDQTATYLRALGTAYGVPSPQPPDVLLTTHGTGRPQSVLEDWFDDLETVFTLMPA